MASMILNGGKKPKPGSDVVKSEPTIIPTKNEMDTSLDGLDTTSLLSNTASTKSKALVDDMQKVTDYQNKLNAKGAGLKVDGIWGDKTAAASREYYNKYQKPQSSSTKSSMKLPKGDKEFKPVTPVSGAVLDVERNNKLSNVGISPTPKKKMSFLDTEGKVEPNTVVEARTKKRDAADQANYEFHREAAISEKMVGDSDLHIPALNRQQAEKAVDIDEKDSPKIRQGLKALGTAGAIVGGATLLGMGIRGKLKNTKAIMAAAKAGEELPGKMKFGQAVMSEVRGSSIGKVANSVQNRANKIEEKIVNPIKRVGQSISDIKNLDKTINSAEEARYLKTNSQKTSGLGVSGKTAAEINQGVQEGLAKKRNMKLGQRVSSDAPVSSDKSGMTLGRQIRQNKKLVPTTTESSTSKSQLLLGDGGKTKSMKLKAGQAVLATRDRVRTATKMKIDKARIPINESNYKSMGYKKEITGGLFRYVKK